MRRISYVVASGLTAALLFASSPALGQGALGPKVQEALRGIRKVARRIAVIVMLADQVDTAPFKGVANAKGPRQRARTRRAGPGTEGQGGGHPTAGAAVTRGQRHRGSGLALGCQRRRGEGAAGYRACACRASGRRERGARCHPRRTQDRGEHCFRRRVEPRHHSRHLSSGRSATAARASSSPVWTLASTQTTRISRRVGAGAAAAGSTRTASMRARTTRTDTALKLWGSSSAAMRADRPSASHPMRSGLRSRSSTTPGRPRSV